MDTLIERLRARNDDLVADLEGLVAIESPSDDLTANAACAAHVSALARRLIGAAAERCEVGGRVHLRWSFGTPRVLLLGHIDTVWPIGTVARWPFEVDGGKATGPGAFDMKAGVVQGLHALTMLDDLKGVAILLTTDEEIGSPTSRALIEDTARGLDAALVLEPSAAGALKTGRKGVSNYVLDIAGRASHAGLDPDRGVNALVELAHQVLAITELARPAEGTTVSPTVARAGTTSNVIPARACIAVDVRAASAEEQLRVDTALRELPGKVPGARLTLSGEINRPALPVTASAALFTLAERIMDRLGLAPLQSAVVGGASDGNFTAGLGVPTLDGLGAVGDGAHAEGEYVQVSAMPERAALVAALVHELLASGA